ncbi:MAG: 50S ribosomal protein L28 [Planctomycetota bacterium]|nr:50S ribosomal protein L28 [Planctomycetota bacterium]
MSRHCEICGKGPSIGIHYKRRGLAKAKGGVGRKIVGKTKRWFKPNLQKIKTISPEGTVSSRWVCTRCIRSGRVTKAPRQKVAAALRAESKAV